MKLSKRVMAGFLFLTLANGSRSAIEPSQPAVSPVISGSTTLLAPYDAPGYSYLALAPGTPLPEGWEQGPFNDSEWKTGSAAFGTGQARPLNSEIHTPLGNDTDLLARKTIFIPAGARGVQIQAALSGDLVEMYFNGVSVSGPQHRTGRARLDDIAIAIPQALVRPGANLAAFHLHSHTGNAFFDLAVAAAAGVREVHAAPPVPVELLPYQAAGYRYKIITRAGNAPPGFERADFNDASWLSGRGAFGNGGSCPLVPTDHTPWHASTDLLVRKFVEIAPGTSEVRVMVAVDNSITGVFFNGMLVSHSGAVDECPKKDQFEIPVPQWLVHPGENLVAYHLRDDGGETFFDTRILALKSLIPIVGAFWKQAPVQVCRGRAPQQTCTLEGSIEVQNTGTDSASAVTVRFILSDDSSAREWDPVLLETSLPILAVGESYTLPVNLKLPPHVSASGKFLIAVFAGPGATSGLENPTDSLVAGPFP